MTKAKWLSEETLQIAEKRTQVIGKGKNEIMPFTATRMDLEIVILSEVREGQLSYDIVYM